MATDFGKRLRQAREQAGMTQEQLCAKVGMAQSTLAAAESKGFGSRKTPQIASACGVDAHWLATGEGEMLPHLLRPPDANTIEGQARVVRESQPLGYRAPISLAQALEALGIELARDLPDDVREDLADALAKLARRRGQHRDQQQVVHLLTSAATAQPTKRTGT